MSEPSGEIVESPGIAYVLLWFPLSSETFIFREIEDLRSLGMSIKVYTMYGKALKGCSGQMRSWPGFIRRMGIRRIGGILAAFVKAAFKKPRFVWQLCRKGLFRKMRNLESQLENTWCFFAGFLLAEYCLSDHISLIHSSWANGPATAAWIASRLSGLPFAFTGRAGDIYPPDGLLAEKAADALFLRANNKANVNWLQSFCPPDAGGKVRLVYNGLTLPNREKWQGEANCKTPSILAIGRFARTKGFPELFTAIARLRRENFPIKLTLVGAGGWKRKLLALRERLGLRDVIEMPGFVPNDQLNKYLASHSMLVVPSVVHSNGDRDGIPNVIMEALSTGMPVIATDVCGISEVIHDGETGLLVPQRDPARLAFAIRQMLADPDNARRMGQQGEALVAAMFDPRENSEKLRALYEDALGRAQAN